MDLRSTKPGLMAAQAAALPFHPSMTDPRTGLPLQALGVGKAGRIWWPVMGGSGEDDPDDVPGGDPDDDDDDEDEDDDEEEEEVPKKGKTSRVKQLSEEAAKYRTRAKEQKARADALEAKIKAETDKDLPADDKLKRDHAEALAKLEQATADVNKLKLEKAFLSANDVTWHDNEDALTMADLSGVEVDEDGNVDRKALRAALKELAKRKPHLVKKASKQEEEDDDDSDEDDKDQRSKKSAPVMKGKRKGEATKTSREDLVRLYPALRKR